MFVATEEPIEVAQNAFVAAIANLTRDERYTGTDRGTRAPTLQGVLDKFDTFVFIISASSCKISTVVSDCLLASLFVFQR